MFHEDHPETAHLLRSNRLPAKAAGTEARLQRAQRSVQAVGLLAQTAIGSLVEIRCVLRLMRMLALHALEPDMPASGRAHLLAELRQLAALIDRIAHAPAYDPDVRARRSLATGLRLRAGLPPRPAVDVTLPIVTAASLGLIGDGLSVASDDAARRAFAALETALATIGGHEATLEAVIARLQVVAAGLRGQARHPAGFQRLSSSNLAAAAVRTLRAQLRSQPALALRAHGKPPQGQGPTRG